MMRALSIIFLLVSLIAGSALSASTIETTSVLHPRTPQELVGELANEYANDVTITPAGDGFLISHNGLGLPDSLVAFLTANMPLEPDTIAPGRPVSLSLSITPEGAGSVLRLMMLSNKSQAPDGIFPDGADVIFTDGMTKNCSGQVVISQDQPLMASHDLYDNWARAQGFDLTTVTDAEGSFFVGQRQGCAIFMNIEPDTEAPERSLVVVRYLEE